MLINEIMIFYNNYFAYYEKIIRITDNFTIDESKEFLFYYFYHLLDHFYQISSCE